MSRFNQWLTQYGYLSEVATDIAIPRWLDQPRIPRQMFTRFYFDAQGAQVTQASATASQSWKARIIQPRLQLKGQVGEIYNKLLAQLRWTFLALEQQWLKSGLLATSGDIFLLKQEEIVTLVQEPHGELTQKLPELIQLRKQQWQAESQLDPVPKLVYGKPQTFNYQPPTINAADRLQGIGSSPGQIEGRIKVISSLQQSDRLDRQTIIVVPYTDAGWSPLLARAGGLISEVGGRLSHGAIVAREYNIPAVMDVDNATRLFQDGQLVRINGQTGIIEILEK